MKLHGAPMQRALRRPSRDRGSALIMAVFVLALLLSAGVALLFMSRTEVRMSQADTFSKKAFYMAEAGLEDARASLFNVNGKESFDDDLLAATGNPLVPVIDFNPDNVQPVYDDDGNFTGLSGYGDDTPIRPLTQFRDGWYAAFLTNDADEGRSVPVDLNNRVMLTGVGVIPGRSIEVVEAVIRKRNLFPTLAPATITLLGDNPIFLSADSHAKDYVGDDCPGGQPGLSMPVVGAIGSDAVDSIEAGWESNPDYVSGAFTDLDTFADLTDLGEPTVTTTVSDEFTDCQSMWDIVETARELADNECSGSISCGTSTPCGPCDPRNTTDGSVTFIDGDYDVSGNLHGHGLLVVTGEAEFGGNVDWSGLIFVVGEGSFRISGSGNGTVSGGLIVADIAGPDGSYGRVCSISRNRCFSSGDCLAGESCVESDDNCTGGDDGFGQSVYDERGGGNAGTVYCTTDLDLSNPPRPYDILSFLQH